MFPLYKCIIMYSVLVVCIPTQMVFHASIVCNYGERQHSCVGVCFFIYFFNQ